MQEGRFTYIWAKMSFLLICRIQVSTQFKISFKSEAKYLFMQEKKTPKNNKKQNKTKEI